MEMKPILFIGSSRDDLREFPAEVRKALGDELLRVQNGLMPVDFKPLKDVAKAPMRFGFTSMEPGA